MKPLFCVLCIFLIACKHNVGTDDQANSYKSFDSSTRAPSTTESEPARNIPGCYMKVMGRDTAILMLEQKGDRYSGILLYDNYEKDGSRGTITGHEEKEILKLWYDFTSEGMRSVMEVYFKKENGRLLRGIGDMDVQTDTTYFISGINYSDKEAFNKVDCKVVDWKLKF
jgi:hypothetical protein